MTDNTFLIAMLGIIMTEALLIAYLKHAIKAKQSNSTNTIKEPEIKTQNSAGSWNRSIERRSRKRSAGALQHRSDGSWAFR